MRNRVVDMRSGVVDLRNRVVEISPGQLCSSVGPAVWFFSIAANADHDVLGLVANIDVLGNVFGLVANIDLLGRLPLKSVQRISVTRDPISTCTHFNCPIGITPLVRAWNTLLADCSFRKPCWEGRQQTLSRALVIVRFFRYGIVEVSSILEASSIEAPIVCIMQLWLLSIFKCLSILNAHHSHICFSIYIYLYLSIYIYLYIYSVWALRCCLSNVVAEHFQMSELVAVLSYRPWTVPGPKMFSAQVWFKWVPR